MAGKGHGGAIWTVLAVAAVALGLAACVQVGGQDFPTATAGFRPKQTYRVSYDAAWDAVIAALNKNQIGIAATSREAGQITTDYIVGKEELYALGLAGGGTSRYRYRIFLSRHGKGDTSINIDCMLESSMNGGMGGGSNGAFHDVSADNPEIVSRLRNWLYQQIESQL